MTGQATTSAAQASLRWHALDFAILRQEQTNWCWNAVAVSVARYFHGDTDWTQCKLANRQLRRRDCCAGGAGGPCNVVGFLDSSLNRVRCLERWAIAKQATQEELKDEIDAERPLCARTAWSAGGAHFVAIVGYLEGGDLIAVDDPFWGQSDLSYDEFRNLYLGAGSWTDSYYTKA